MDGQLWKESPETVKEPTNDSGFGNDTFNNGWHEALFVKELDLNQHLFFIKPNASHR